MATNNRSGALQGTSAALDIGIAPQYQRVPAGATIDLTVTARVVGNGAPIKSKTVTFQLTHGTGTLTSASAVTSASGYASTTLHVANSTGDTDVAACVDEYTRRLRSSGSQRA